MALPEHYHKSPKYKLVITSLLANFVAVYCEYKGGNTRIGSLLNSLYDKLPDKEKDQMAWVRAANQHRAIAEEIILKELIYV